VHQRTAKTFGDSLLFLGIVFGCNLRILKEQGL